MPLLNFCAGQLRAGQRGTRLMTTISSPWHWTAAVSPLALMIATTPASAQDAQVPVVTATTAAAAAQPATQPAPPSDTQANPQNTTTNDQSIVVTGFRASLRSATAKKKNSVTVVESVTEEEIGKLQ